jgi:hypothetical protein
VDNSLVFVKMNVMRKIILASLVFFCLSFYPGLVLAQTANSQAWIDFMKSFYSPVRSSSMSLSSLSPNLGRPGTLVTINGQGFSRTSNRIYTGFGVIEGVVSADSRHLSFTVDYLGDQFAKAQSTHDDKVKSMRVPLWIYVENATGISNEKIFWLRFDPKNYDN